MKSRPVVAELLNWMTTQHMSEHTGLFGQLDVNDPRGLSRAVMGGYHFWLLYFQDRIAIMTTSPGMFKRCKNSHLSRCFRFAS
jgi:hypothetical protein